ncbi:MAG: ABC transporter permease [Solirubrobacteraceae bacterium]|nr:ABC transporter permease [Solirubrobacteraceae bacterium]
MITVPYARFELVRLLRNRQFMIFAVGFPLVLYFLMAGPNRDEADFGDSGIPAPVYYMVSMVAWGTMMSMLSTGARIAGERSAGWNRQLRVTPLTGRAYLLTKLATGFAMAGIAMVTLYASGVVLGVRLDGGRWVTMTALILVGLLPFAALGVLMGHRLSIDAVGPVMGGGVGLLAFVSGFWFPSDPGSTLDDVGRQLPSYWLVQAGHVGIGGDAWPLHGWIVLVTWTALLSLLAIRAYLGDTDRL